MFTGLKSAPDFHPLSSMRNRRTLRFDEERAASWNCPPIESMRQLITPASGVHADYLFCLFFPLETRPKQPLCWQFAPSGCLFARHRLEQVADNGVRQYSAAVSFVLPFRHFEFRHGNKASPAATGCPRLSIVCGKIVPRLARVAASRRRR